MARARQYALQFRFYRSRMQDSGRHFRIVVGPATGNDGLTLYNYEDSAPPPRRPVTLKSKFVRRPMSFFYDALSCYLQSS